MLIPWTLAAPFWGEEQEPPIDVDLVDEDDEVPSAVASTPSSTLHEGTSKTQSNQAFQQQVPSVPQVPLEKVLDVREERRWTTSARRSFSVGDRVRYKGSALPALNSGRILTLHSREPGGCWCVTSPDSDRLSTWIPPEDLELVREDGGAA